MFFYYLHFKTIFGAAVGRNQGAAGTVGGARLEAGKGAQAPSLGHATRNNQPQRREFTASPNKEAHAFETRKNSVACPGCMGWRTRTVGVNK